MDIRNASGWKTLEVAGWKFSGKKTEVEKDISFHSGPTIKLNKEPEWADSQLLFGNEKQL